MKRSSPRTCRTRVAVLAAIVAVAAAGALVAPERPAAAGSRLAVASETQAKRHCVPGPAPETAGEPDQRADLDQTYPHGEQADWLRRMREAAVETGIHRRDYEKDRYDCDDFAGDMEAALEALGYTATFTVYWCDRGKDGGWAKGHAVTDVHAPDGTVVWIDPQSRTAEVHDLDFDDSGSVGVATAHASPWPATEKGCRIEVYADRAAAEAAGVKLD